MVAEKNVTKNIGYGRTDGSTDGQSKKSITPLLRNRGIIIKIMIIINNVAEVVVIVVEVVLAVEVLVVILRQSRKQHRINRLQDISSRTKQ